MLVEWVMAIIAAYASTWAPRECSEGDERCVTENAEKEAKLEELATAIIASSEREGLDPLMVVSIISRESSFLPEPCGRRVAMENVISWEPDGRSDSSFTLKWKCPSSVWGPECEKRVFDAEERDGYLFYSTCSADEVGYMQIVPWTEWALAGAVIPGTEQTIPGVTLTGEEGDRVVELHASPDLDWSVPDVENEMVIQITLPDDRHDRDDDPEIWGSIVTSIETIDTGVKLRLLEGLPEDLEGFTDYVIARGLPRASRDRRSLLLSASINVSIGCREIADHRSANTDSGEEVPWWNWIGAYNTGTVHGQTSHAYASRILHRYDDFCSYTVPQPDGTQVELREVWDNCSFARDELEENPEEY